MSSDTDSEAEGWGGAGKPSSTVDDAASPSRQRPSPTPLRLTKLCVSAGTRALLQDVTLTLPAGKITVIVGASGAGKSVLLRALAGLIPREGPEVRWSGTIELGSDDRAGQDLAKRVGIVFQQFALFDELSPVANVQFAIDHRSDHEHSSSQTARDWLDELGVPAGTRVAGLSGGQKQRLAIARTLAADPPIVLYDEPTSGLDAASGAKVSELIRRTNLAHRRTSIIVTHDYETLIPIADQVLLLDSETRRLVRVSPEEWSEIPSRMKPLPGEGPELEPATAWQNSLRLADHFLTESGSAVLAAFRLPYDVLPLFPRWKWGLRFFAHYLRLVGGPSAWFYLILSGMIIGFTSTYFTFRFLPFRLYTQPLLIDELLATIGFALYRVLVPVLATILIAARCGAAVTADVGVKQYGGQVDAMRTLGVKPKWYLLVPIVMAFVVATPLLEWLAFTAARLMSLATFSATHPNIGPFYWGQHFYRSLVSVGGTSFLGWQSYDGWAWVLFKNLACGVGTAAIGYYRGLQPKHSARDVSSAITSTVLWTTLYVLIIHFLVALYEF